MTSGKSGASGDANPGFAGDKKEGQSILGPLEARVIDRLVTKVPQSIETYHLTMCTLGWAIGAVVFGQLAATNRAYLWAMSAMVFGQYLTDALDGKVGRVRDTGLIKWGFFMDHFLDMLFAGCVVIGYSYLAPTPMVLEFQILLLVTIATMGVSFLSFAATNKFRIAFYGIGPTEVRIGYLILNAILFFFGTEIYSWGVPLVLAGNIIVLLVLAVRTHRELWALDMANKAARDAA